MLASQNGHLDVVRELIGKGAQIDMQANDGYSALIVASQNGHLDVVRELIGKGAQIDMQENNGYSALIVASQNGHLDVVRELIGKGAQIDMQENDSGQSKWTSGCSQRTDWKGCSDRHASKQWLIIVASLKGHLDVVRELIGKGAQIDMQENDGYSALIAGQSKMDIWM